MAQAGYYPAGAYEDSRAPYNEPIMDVEHEDIQQRSLSQEQWEFAMNTPMCDILAMLKR